MMAWNTSPNAIPGLVPAAAVASLPQHTQVTVIGVVADALEPIITRTGEWMLTFRICDQSVLGDSNAWNNGVKVRVFKKVQTELPSMKTGTVAIIRNVKRVVYAAEAILVFGFFTSASNLRLGAIPDPQYIDRYVNGAGLMDCACWPPSAIPSVSEILHLLQLKVALGDRVEKELLSHGSTQGGHGGHGGHGRQIWQAGSSNTRFNVPDHGQNTENRSKGPSLRVRKFSLIQDLQFQVFYDLIVEVVKIFPTMHGYTELQVTDYTENKHLYDHAAPEEPDAPISKLSATKQEFPGPYGQRVLTIEVHPPHASHISQHVKPGEFVEIKNVRIKMSRVNKMEGNLYRDQLSPSKLLIGKIKASSCEEGRELLARRRDYWAKRTGFNLNMVQGNGIHQGSKKKRKRDKERQAMEQAVANKSFDAISVRVNQHVRCATHDIRLSTLSDLVSFRGSFRQSNKTEADLPFVNQKRKCQVRVVDYYPPRLCDWTSDSFHGNGNDEDDGDGMRQSSAAIADWRWDFCLLVEDAAKSADSHQAPKKDASVSSNDSEDIWLHVSHSAAQYLLDLDALDLKSDGGKVTLDKLGRKIDILCGNLQELKRGKEEADHDPDEDGRGNGVDAGYGHGYDAGVSSRDYWAGRLSNLPFTCCIQESGQRLDSHDQADAEQADWIRIYDLFETQIL